MPKFASVVSVGPQAQQSCSLAIGLLDHAKRLPTSLRWTASPRERLRRDYGVTGAAECALPTKRSLTIQYQRHCHGDNQRSPVAAGRARAATPILPQRVLPAGPGACFAPVSKEQEAAGAAFLSSPPAVFRWRGKCSSLGGLSALIALLAHHFFSCSVTGKPLAATTHVGVTKMHALTAVKCKKLEAQDAVLGCVQGEISSPGTNHGCDLFP